MDLRDVFAGCDFEKTDGYRYVIVDSPAGELVKLMESLSIAFDGERKSYQIPSVNPNAGHIVDFIDQRLSM